MAFNDNDNPDAYNNE
jgi:hypothetical protein